jgi:hypothetical protein
MAKLLVLLYGIAEYRHYRRYYTLWRRFEYLCVSRPNALQIEAVADAILSQSTDVFRRAALFSATRHIVDRPTLVASLTPGQPLTSSARWQIGGASLHRLYLPVAVSWVRTMLRTAMVWRMRAAGFARAEYPTEIGAYSIWSRTVHGTKPILFFPGFGLGAAPYAPALVEFGRTVYMVELPNLGGSAERAPGYLTPDSLYRVVRLHTRGLQHDVIAHSLGTSAAAAYVNQQHMRATADTAQVVIMCDGFVSPVDTMVSHLFPFLDTSAYEEIATSRCARVSPTEFATVVWMLVHNLDCSAYTKRFHTVHDCTLWRPDYACAVYYVYGERDLLYDVPHIQRSLTDRSHYLFIPRAGHGACFFGRRRSGTLRHMAAWMARHRAATAGVSRTGGVLSVDPH